MMMTAEDQILTALKAVSSSSSLNPRRRWDRNFKLRLIATTWRKGLHNRNDIQC